MAPGGESQFDVAVELVVDTLVALDLPVQQVAEDKWMTMLSGEHKRTIPLLFTIGQRSVRLASLLTGRPDENHGQVHRRLLRHNERAGWVHFAVDGEGDIVLVGRITHAAFDERVLDEVLGEVLTVSDGLFNSVLRTGFADYIAAEQRWRATNGLPPNPVSTTG